MNEPRLIRVFAPDGANRMIDIDEITSLDRAWIYENCEIDPYTGYPIATVEMLTKH